MSSLLVLHVVQNVSLSIACLLGCWIGWGKHVLHISGHKMRVSGQFTCFLNRAWRNLELLWDVSFG